MFLTYLQNNWIEIVGAILSLIYLYLSIKQKISLWIFGFLCSAMYVVVFYQSKFYADMTLQFYYLAVSVYGWINWKLGKQQTGHEIPVIRTSKRMSVYLGLVIVFVFGLYYLVLVRFTDSPIPIGDSFTTALSVVATWMLARKMLENWLLWIIADSLLVGLFIYKGLFPTAILFVIYTLMAVVGYWQWKKTMVKFETESI
jgi:nicotinamide mononucleotide transporter